MRADKKAPKNCAPLFGAFFCAVFKIAPYQFQSSRHLANTLLSLHDLL
ncbi:hypothetical protein MDV102.5 [Gallid alphaherpesvirus 2]|nr:hypothetical protein MDV081.5 [Gallid alphaherpesvirus 2]UOW64433.1 hypothetical protein MDV102.5 [Gallid alphaherpesvirus 2]